MELYTLVEFRESDRKVRPAIFEVIHENEDAQNNVRSIGARYLGTGASSPGFVAIRRGMGEFFLPQLQSIAEMEEGVELRLFPLEHAVSLSRF